jgi:hypothetical protein
VDGTLQQLKEEGASTPPQRWITLDYLDMEKGIRPCGVRAMDLIAECNEMGCHKTIFLCHFDSRHKEQESRLIRRVEEVGAFI